tara:strand:- start:3042 stop:3434 length:393 start_codon:yes stop_codon:yes gene_type:complete
MKKETLTRGRDMKYTNTDIHKLAGEISQTWTEEECRKFVKDKLVSLYRSIDINTKTNKFKEDWELTFGTPKKYKVYVSWTVCAETVVEAKDEVEAIDLAHGMDLDTFDNQDYVQNSFEADYNMVEEHNEV